MVKAIGSAVAAALMITPQVCQLWQADGSGGTGDQGGGTAPDAVKAREALSQIYHDPKLLEGVDDATVLDRYGKASAAFKPQGWGEDWRQRIAGENKEHLKTLERFTDPGAVFTSYAALRQQRDSGELKSNKPFPEKGTDAEKGEWRKDNGLPEAADKYEVKLPAGVVLGEADKPLVDDFKKHAYESNMSPSALNAAVGWWVSQRTAREAQAAEETKTRTTETEESLRAEWGPEYQGTMNRVKGLVDSLAGSKELAESVMGSIKQNAAFAKMFGQMAFQLNPTGALTPGDGGNAQATIETQIAAIEKTMGTPAYTKDESKQSELRNLYGAYERLSGHPWDKRPRK